MRIRRLAVALLAWSVLALGREVSICRVAALWVDLPAAIGAGPRGWLAASAWGMRCRWEEIAPEDRQRIADACGPAALRAVLRHRGLAAPQTLLWSLCRVPGGGTTLGRLAAIAGRFGHASCLVWNPGLDSVETPAIVHLARGHFVVLEERCGRAVRILDPACGRVCVPAETLRRLASGAMLVFPAAQTAVRPNGAPERRRAS